MCVRTDLEKSTLVDRQRKKLPLDTLAVVTSHQRRLVEAVYIAADDLQRLPAIKVALHSSQPAHVVAVAAVLLVCSLPQLSPEQSNPASHGLFTNLTYLASFSAHLGNQFWMTFVSGLALYFNLPRHHFGAVQKVLFPKYFSINSFLSLITLVSFTKMYHMTSIETPEIIQVVVLSGCFLLELMIRLYVVPPVIQMITAKTQLERTAGVGGEVGHWDPGPLLHCPHYHRLHTQFRRQHLVVAAGNMLTMACTSIHLYYLASQRG